MISKTIPYNGCVTFWSAGEAQHSQIEAAMNAAGLSEYCPQPRTDASALRLAIDAYAKAHCAPGMDYEVAPLERSSANGFELVWVSKGTQMNQRTHVLSASYAGGAVSITCGQGSTWELHTSFQAHKSLITTDAIGRSLVRLATQKLDGLCLRPNGGLYWIPDCHVSDWQFCATVMENCTKSVVTTAAWEANPSTIARIRESLLSDVEQECSQLLADLSDGQAHDDEYFERRAQRMRRLLSRVETVESALQNSLDDCRRRLDLVQSVFTAATIASL